MLTLPFPRAPSPAPRQLPLPISLALANNDSPTHPLPFTLPAVYTIYLLAVRPYNVALVGAFELVTTLCTLATSGLTMALMDGRGSSDFTR